jgi:hypothetical protein
MASSLSVSPYLSLEEPSLPVIVSVKDTNAVQTSKPLRTHQLNIDQTPVTRQTDLWKGWDALRDRTRIHFVEDWVEESKLHLKTERRYRRGEMCWFDLMVESRVLQNFAW